MAARSLSRLRGFTLVVLAALGAAAAEPICPRVAEAPSIDGTLDDAAWKCALVLSDFTLPRSDERPAKAIEARLCFDAQALYLAFACEEPHPDRIKARATEENDDVWQDDCVEVWVRTTDSMLEYDQFIANTLGTRQSLRKRRGATGAWKPKWQPAVRKEATRWTVELRIPFADLGIATPRPGDMVQLKLGREDHTGRKEALATWPPGSPYAGADGYAAVYFETANLLSNPHLARGKRSGWSYGKGDEPLFDSVADGGRQAIRFRAPGRYAVMQQALRLKPHARYRLEADVKGTAGVYIRSRVVLKPGAQSTPFTITAKPSADYRHADVQFPTGPDGKALVIIGGTDSLGKGEVHIAGLNLVRVPGAESVGPAIAVEPGAATVVEKLPVADCRNLRGFLGTPVDGTTRSRGWGGQVWEYNQSAAGAGTGYQYRGSDGLHVTLADRRGFNALLIRGGARVKLYRDCTRYDDPASGTLVADLPGSTSRTRVAFDPPLATDRISFFDLTDGRLADVSFLRVHHGGDALSEPEKLVCTGPFEPGPLAQWLNGRFEKKHRTTFGLAPQGKGSRLKAPKGRVVHLIGKPFAEEKALTAVGLDFAVGQGATPLPFTLAVQDPLNPRRQLAEADFVLSEPGRCTVVLDFPDQVVPTGARLWLSLTFDADAQLESPAALLFTVSRDQALPQALAYRKFLLATCFCALSEARPWMGWYDDRRMARSLAQERWGPQLKELAETLEHCKRLGPKDDIVRQYDEWIYQSYRPRRRKEQPSDAKIAAVPGAPEWAVVARQAWLAARDVPRWWLEQRRVPTGELGGLVGDDTDLYQNFADFPMFETDGVAALIKDGAARLAELAERENLEAGLNRRATDPLHAYEEGINHEALMAWWHYGDPVYLERCIVAARSTEALTIVTPKGHRHFRSQRCGAGDLRNPPKTDVDGHAHPLMWHPTLEVAWYNANPRALKHLREWADGWLEHMPPTDYATAVEVATERVVSTTSRPLYGGYGGQGSAFLFLYWITGEQKYLEPFFRAFRKGSRNTSPHLILPELIHRHGLAFLGPKLAELVSGEGPSETLVTGRKQPLIDALKRDIAHLQRFPHMYTTAEQYTDRIFLYAIRNATVAYTGGYASRNKLHHTHAVSWEGFGTEYAALVLRARRNELKVLLYSFADAPLAGRFRTWTLDHGQYRLRLGPDADGDDAMDKAAREETLEVVRGTPIPLTLAPKTVTLLELTQLRRLDDERLRADLALAAREIRIEGAAVHAVAHNIGSRSVASFDAALLDPQGKVRARKTLATLDAPLDLVPKRLPFTLDGAPADPKGWTLALDPEGRIPEIFEGNNRAALPPR